MPFKPSRVVLVVFAVLVLLSGLEVSASHLRSAIANGAARRLSHSIVEPTRMESNRRRGPALTELSGYKQVGTSRASLADAKASTNNGGRGNKP